MLEIDLYLDDRQLRRLNSFPDSLGYAMWNIAVLVAPMDTGNLKRAISMSRNTRTLKRINYDLLDANYIKFLELGLGSVKQHKGFIEVKTLSSMVETLVNFAILGIVPPHSKTPHVTLGDTSAIFSQEKKILSSVNIKTDRINANVRRRISRLREIEHRKKMGLDIKSTGGKRIETTNYFSYGSNRGNSMLSKAYTEAKKG